MLFWRPGAIEGKDKAIFAVEGDLPKKRQILESNLRDAPFRQRALKEIQSRIKSAENKRIFEYLAWHLRLIKSCQARGIKTVFAEIKDQRENVQIIEIIAYSFGVERGDVYWPRLRHLFTSQPERLATPALSDELREMATNVLHAATHWYNEQPRERLSRCIGGLEKVDICMRECLAIGIEEAFARRGMDKSTFDEYQKYYPVFSEVRDGLMLYEYHGKVGADRPTLEAIVSKCRELSVREWRNAEYKTSALFFLGCALNHLGELTSSLDQLSQAVTAHRKAIENKSRSDPNDLSAFASALAQSLSSLAHATGDDTFAREAAQLCKSALEDRITNEGLGAWAETQNILGSVLRMIGIADHDPVALWAAVRAHEAALQGRRDSPLLWAATQSDLGNSYSMLGELTHDTQYLLRALSAYRASLASKPRRVAPGEWARAHGNLCTVLLTLGMTTGERKYIARAIRHCRRQLLVTSQDNDPVIWSATQYRLGQTLAVAFQTTDDRKYLDEAIITFNKTLELYSLTNHPIIWAHTNIMLGRLFEYSYNLTGGQSDLLSCVAAYRAGASYWTFEVDPIKHLDALNALSGALLQSGEWTEVVDLLSPAVGRAPAIVLSMPSLQMQRGAVREVAEAGDNLAYALIKLGKPKEAITAISSTRAVVHGLAQLHRQKTHNSGHEKMLTALAEWRIAQLSSDRADEVFVRGLQAQQLSTITVTSVGEQRALREIAYERFQAALAEVQPDTSDDVTYTDLQASIPDGAVFVIIIITRAGGLALTLFSGSEIPYVLELKELNQRSVLALRDEWLISYNSFRLALSESAREHDAGALDQAFSTWDDSILTQMSKLGLLLGAPLSIFLRNHGADSNWEITFCASPLLAAFPLHAMNSDGPDVDRIFLDNWATSCIPSPASYVRSRRRIHSMEGYIPSLLAITNPSGDLPTNDNPAWESFRSHSRKALANSSATIDLVRAAISDYSYISYLGHGAWNFDNVGRAALVLADGLFEPEALSDLTLEKCRLVFLAACEAGLVDLTVPSESIGLPASFMEVGVPCVISALWVIARAETEQILHDFFSAHLAGVTPARALRQAQLRLRGRTFANTKLSGKSTVRGPVWWAALCVNGG